MAWYWWVVLMPVLLYAAIGGAIGGLNAVSLVYNWRRLCKESPWMLREAIDFTFFVTLFGPIILFRDCIEKISKAFSPR